MVGHGGDMEPTNDELDYDMVCDCGCLTFHIRFQDGDMLAVCSDCGEATTID
jgi:hypothetical protein